MGVITATVILIAYRGDRWIEPCLDSLYRGWAADRRLILVDNGGNRRVDDQAGRANLRLIRTPRAMGFAEANNFALMNGGLDGRYVCFLNQDTVSRQDWLGPCIDALRADETVGAAIPLIENYDGTAWDEAFMTCCRAAPRLYHRFVPGVDVRTDDLPPWIEVPEITAAAMVVRTEALLQAGPFDPIYGSYYEDYDLCRRVAATGYKVGICTRGRVGHFGGSVTTDRVKYRARARWITRNRVIYAVRWKWSNRRLGLLRYVLRTMPRDGIRSLLGRSRTPFVAFLAGHRDLIRLLPRLLSAKRDRAAWCRYLTELGWPATDSAKPAPSPIALAAGL